MREFTLLLASVTVAAINAEAPVRSGPYPAAGWRPQTPFNLPREYLTPVVERQQQPQTVEIEISKERVDFAGQIQSRVHLSNMPQSVILQPNTNNLLNQNYDFLQIQQLPVQEQPQQFLHKQIVSRPAPALTQFLRKQVLSRTVVPQQSADQAPFGQRILPRPQQQNFQTTQQPLSTENQDEPKQEYGAPVNDGGQLNIVYTDATQDSDDENSTDNLTPIEALNAAIDDYNRRVELKKNKETNENNATHQTEDDGNGYNIAPPNSSRFSQGQYYVLGPDNSIQRVMFTTTQDEEEAKTNGFTAQLKYTPVGELRDPVFKYNERGQLVRILK